TEEVRDEHGRTVSMTYGCISVHDPGQSVPESFRQKLYEIAVERLRFVWKSSQPEAQDMGTIALPLQGAPMIRLQDIHPPLVLYEDSYEGSHPLAYSPLRKNERSVGEKQQKGAGQNLVSGGVRTILIAAAVLGAIFLILSIYGGILSKQ